MTFAAAPPALRLAEATLDAAFGDFTGLSMPGRIGARADTLDSIDDATLAEVIAVRCRELSSPSLPMSLRGFLDVTGRTLQDMCTWVMGEGAVDAVYFPVDALQDAPRRHAPTIPWYVADTHLHSGASASIAQLLAGLLEQTAIPDEARRRRLDIASLPAWTVEEFLGTLRWSGHLLWMVLDHGSMPSGSLECRGFADNAVEALRARSLWPNLFTTEGMRKQLAGASFHIPGRFPGVGPVLRASIASGDDTVWHCAEIWLACIAALARLVRSYPGEGLDRFVRRFQQVDFIRDIATASRPRLLQVRTDGDPRVEILTESLRNVVASEMVVGVEMRKTVRSNDVSAFRTKVASSLSDHAGAFAQFSFSQGRALQLSMPVTFERNNARSNIGYRLAPRPLPELRHAISGTEALGKLIKDGPVDASMIGAVDVVGQESGSSNWPFLAMSRRLREVGLSFYIHAGEDYSSELNGVRRVGECLLPSVCADRVGHALAAHPGTGPLIACLPAADLRVSDVVQDLCWVLSWATGDLRSDARRLLGPMLEPDGGVDPIGIDDWTRAYLDLFELQALESAGILLRNFDGSLTVATVAEILDRVALSQFPSMVAMCALATVGEGINISPRVPRLDRSLTTEEGRLYAAFSSDWLGRCREYVLSRVKDAGVTVECCPTSNLVLANLEGLPDHPFWDWTRAGIQATVSSDDPIHFGTNVLIEYQKMRQCVDSDETLGQLSSAASHSVAICSGGRRWSADDWQRQHQMLRGWL